MRPLHTDTAVATREPRLTPWTHSLTGGLTAACLLLGLTASQPAHAESVAPCTADFNDDGLVDILDFELLRDSFAPGGCTDCAGDADEDGDVDIQDYSSLAREWGRADCPLFDGPRVLIIHDGITSSTDALLSALQGDGIDARYSAVDETEYDGTNPMLDNYDVVVHLNSNTWLAGQDMPAEGQQAIDDFVWSGGGYIGTEWTSFEVYAWKTWGGEERYAHMDDLRLFDFQGSLCTSRSLMVPDYAQENPITFGLEGAEIEGCFSDLSIRQFDGASAHVLLKHGPSMPAVAIRTVGWGQAVGLNLAMNYQDGAFGLGTNPAVQQLFTNAVRWIGEDRCDSDDGYRYGCKEERQSQAIMTFEEAIVEQGIVLREDERARRASGEALVGRVGELDWPIKHANGVIERPARTFGFAGEGAYEGGDWGAAGASSTLSALSGDERAEAERADSQERFEALVDSGEFNPDNPVHRAWEDQYHNRLGIEVVDSGSELTCEAYCELVAEDQGTNRSGEYWQSEELDINDWWDADREMCSGSSEIDEETGRATATCDDETSVDGRYPDFHESNSGTGDAHVFQNPHQTCLKQQRLIARCSFSENKYIDGDTTHYGCDEAKVHLSGYNSVNIKANTTAEVMGDDLPSYETPAGQILNGDNYRLDRTMASASATASAKVSVFGPWNGSGSEEKTEVVSNVNLHGWSYAECGKRWEQVDRFCYYDQSVGWSFGARGLKASMDGKLACRAVLRQIEEACPLVRQGIYEVEDTSSYCQVGSLTLGGHAETENQGEDCSVETEPGIVAGDRFELKRADGSTELHGQFSVKHSLGSLSTEAGLSIRASSATSQFTYYTWSDTLDMELWRKLGAQASGQVDATVSGHLTLVQSEGALPFGQEVSIQGDRSQTLSLTCH